MLLDAKKNMSLYHESPFVISDLSRIEIVEDGENINIEDGMMAKAIFTPGHNPSCITWLIGDAIFTGDSYIPGIKTVTNLPGGDKKLAAEMQNIIMDLAVGKTLYPGHKIF